MRVWVDVCVEEVRLLSSYSGIKTYHTRKYIQTKRITSKNSNNWIIMLSTILILVYINHYMTIITFIGTPTNKSMIRSNKRWV